jgi:hypothetical protein
MTPNAPWYLQYQIIVPFRIVRRSPRKRLFLARLLDTLGAGVERTFALCDLAG